VLTANTTSLYGVELSLHLEIVREFLNGITDNGNFSLLLFNYFFPGP
jgi:hypothetical protein